MSVGKKFFQKTILILCLFLPCLGFASMKHKFISYSDVGKGEPIVFIHAFPTDQRLWEPQKSGLKNYFRVISIDLWGFGKSTRTDGSAITMTEYADEVKTLLDQLHIKKAIIGGESMGGYISLAFFKKYPQLVKGLILASTQAVAPTSQEILNYQRTAQDVLTNGSKQLIENFLPKAVSTNASKELRENLKEIFSSQSLTGIASSLRGMALREDTSDSLRNTEIPVLIITGELDAVISTDQSRVMHKITRNSKLMMVPNVGHLINIEAPTIFNNAIIKMFHH